MDLWHDDDLDGVVINRDETLRLNKPCCRRQSVLRQADDRVVVRMLVRELIEDVAYQTRLAPPSACALRRDLPDPLGNRRQIGVGTGQDGSRVGRRIQAICQLPAEELLPDPRVSFRLGPGPAPPPPPLPPRAG